MSFIVGTAGHIDHGKTSLIKALTGQDTDRLKEEKERGISIDLGFAHLELPDGTRAGVVDVPGHERFIRNMLAGAHGIDLVLFTVAADDGVMPQTEEHLEIVRLLGVERAIFAITKADLVAPARVIEVEEEIGILTEGTPLRDSPAVPCSVVTGEGLERLRSLIEHELRHAQKGTPPGYFRLPVDRVFVLQGHGLVVTGTARSGTVAVGDRVRCLPGDQLYRVRSLQVHGQTQQTAAWGQRIALNLSGSDKPVIERGDVICHERLTRCAHRFDATLDLRPSRGRIKNHQRVRVHMGTAERLAKLVLLEPQNGRAGELTFCQLVLTAPLLALRGDRFVVRDETARRTLGGGVVVHPWARAHRRREAGLRERLEALRGGDVATLVELFLDEAEEFAIPLAPIHQWLNVQESATREVVRGLPAIRVIQLDGGDLYTTGGRWRALQAALVATVQDFHAAHPLAPGQEMEDVRDRLPHRLSATLFRAFVEQLERERVIAREGSLLRHPEHRITMSNDEQRLVEQIRAQLGVAPLAPPDLRQLERDTGVGRATLVEILRVLERDRVIVRVAPDLYFLRESIDTVTRLLRQEFAGEAAITPAQFRDRLGTSRKYVIPLLEYLDREGVTMRQGDTRRLRSAPGARPHT